MAGVGDAAGAAAGLVEGATAGAWEGTAAGGEAGVEGARAGDATTGVVDGARAPGEGAWLRSRCEGAGVLSGCRQHWHDLCRVGCVGSTGGVMQQKGALLSRSERAGALARSGWVHQLVPAQSVLLNGPGGQCIIAEAWLTSRASRQHWALGQLGVPGQQLVGRVQALEQSQRGCLQASADTQRVWVCAGDRCSRLSG